MEFNIRTDLGGKSSECPALLKLKHLDIVKPFVFIVGGNGSGKTTLLSAIRNATMLTGDRLGHFNDNYDRHGGETIEPARSYVFGDAPKFDPGYYAVMRRKNKWSDSAPFLPLHSAGVVDVDTLGWRGQRVWLHDARSVDENDALRDGLNLAQRRIWAENATRSHGEAALGYLRYATAWALGLFDLKDPFDMIDDKDTQRGDNRAAERRLLDHVTEGKSRSKERWLLLDEPENGVAPERLAQFFATYAEHCKAGRLRVICATHSPLVDCLETHPSVQIVDLDAAGVDRMADARRLLTNASLRRASARVVEKMLRHDLVEAEKNTALSGQGRFDCHTSACMPLPECTRPAYAMK